MLDIDQFIFDCKDALRQDPSQSCVREVVAPAVAAPAAVLKALGEPQKAEIQTLYKADNLIILNVIWAPWMTLLPHNHQMWGVIGIYTGREDNIFWRRVQDGKSTKVEAAGARELAAKDVSRWVTISSIQSRTRFLGSRAQSTFMVATFLGRSDAANGMQKPLWNNLATA